MAKTDDGGLGTLLLLGGAGLAAYLLLRPREAAAATPRSRATQVMPVPPSQPPASLATVAAVSSRFAEVRDLYRMGRLTPPEAWDQANGLRGALSDLARRGAGDRTAITVLADDISAFMSEVEGFMRFQASAG